MRQQSAKGAARTNNDVRTRLAPHSVGTSSSKRAGDSSASQAERRITPCASASAWSPLVFAVTIVTVLLGTGLGPVDPPLGTGAPSNGNQITSTATMTIDGLPADIQFAGIAPGFVGLNQINVVVPGLARTNAADPVILTINGVPANPVTLPVGPQ
jgi:uncharacterized protein (TIGR03437 family)